MQLELSLNKPKCLLNPWFDILLLACFPLAIIIFFVLNYLLRYNYTVLPNLYQNVFYLIGQMHFVATFAVVYMDRGQFKNMPLAQTLWLPLLIAVYIFWALMSGRFVNLTVSLIFYWILWHILAQNHYILKFHNLRTNIYNKPDFLINSLAMISGPVYLILNFYKVI
ncbi:MAG: hypothetical protein AB1481_07265, partial [Candidatus Omnitrophota bacterium]